MALGHQVDDLTQWMFGVALLSESDIAEGIMMYGNFLIGQRVENYEDIVDRAIRNMVNGKDQD